MLSFFRRGGTAQVLVVAIAVAIIIVFVLEFRAGGAATGASLSTECAVEVHDRCVQAKDFQTALNLTVPRMLESKQIRELGLRRHVLEGLAERELLLAEAERLGISASEEELDEQLFKGIVRVSLPAAQAEQLSYQLGLCRRGQMGCEPGAEIMVRQLDVDSTKTGKFDYDKYKRMVRNIAGRNPRDFKEMQHEELVASRMRDLIRARTHVAEQEAFAIYERAQSRATVRTVPLERDWFARFVVDASDEAIEEWAKAHKEQVDAAWKTEKENFKADCPLVREISVEFPPGASDQDKVLARDRIEAAKEALGKRRPFSEVARLYSEAESAMVGGYAGCLTAEAYGAAADELIPAVKDLKRGDVSSILETSRGFHIVKYLGQLDKAKVEAEGRQAIARELAVRFLADEAVESFAAKLMEAAKEGQKLEKAAEELAKQVVSEDVKEKALEQDSRPKVDISAPFPIMGRPVRNAAPTENVAAKVFELEKADALLPEPVKTASGLAVVQLKEKDLVTREEFDTDRAEILRGLRQRKSQSALVRYLAQLRKEAGEKVVYNSRFLEEQNQEGEETPDEG